MSTPETRYNDADSEVINGKELFKQVSEGDYLVCDHDDTRMTVVRHIDGDDDKGQLVTMRQIRGASGNAWCICMQNQHGVDVQMGDIITSEHTGDEMFFLRGDDGAAYLLKQQWSKVAGQWDCKVMLYRRTREEDRQWEWQNHVNLKKIDTGVSTDYDNPLSDGLPWAVNYEPEDTVWIDCEKGHKVDVFDPLN